MAGFNIQRLRDILDAVYDSATGTFKTSTSGGAITNYALESTGNLATIAGRLPSTLGAKTAANSFSTAIAQDEFVETQLIAPSSTTARSMVGYSRATIGVLVGSINTNVVVRVEVSNDGTNWDNANATDTDTTITAAKLYRIFNYEGCPKFIRTTFVSESGGTAATLDVVTRLSA